MTEESFLSVLKEAKVLFLEKLQAETELKTKNGKLLEDIKQLESDNETLLLENKRLIENVKTSTDNLERATEEIKKLSDKLKNSKNFVKMYFKDQLDRMKEIEKNGIFNAETFSYLVGEIGRSLCSTTLNQNNNNPTNAKKPCLGKLSTNKENRRARYEELEPTKDHTKLSPTHREDKKLITTNTVKRQGIANSKKRNEPLLDKDKESVNVTTKTFPSQENMMKNQKTFSKNVNLRENNRDISDPESTLCSPISPPFNSSIQIETIKKRETTHQMKLKNQKASPSKNSTPQDNQNFLDPDLTLRSPIGPPSKSSTPQGAHSGEEQKKFVLAFSPRETSSPSILSHLSEGDIEGPRCTLLPQLLSMGGDCPEQSEPQSPTIPSRSHSFTRPTVLAAASPEHRTPKRKRIDMSFGSTVSDSFGPSSKVTVNDSSSEIKTAMASENENRKQFSKAATVSDAISPEIIVLDDSDFAKPACTGVPRKKTKTSSSADESGTNSSILLFASPQRSNSPAPKSSNTRADESDKINENEYNKQEQPKIALNFSLDEIAGDERIPDREKEKGPQYKYKEVVRGKDKRAKLNGYFCADCEKYYGSLKLSDEEMKERLKACSRHRARFSPPPSTPEHFWTVDFMNTHEYIEKGFMRTESELPPEKRRLKSRRLKGKLQK